ncbi:MAG: hypothetical protein CL840_18540 [Crocinitomicaceae bacterium]|nr:hypothetical protein [Crocinitomicaceae bacterium]
MISNFGQFPTWLIPMLLFGGVIHSQPIVTSSDSISIKKEASVSGLSLSAGQDAFYPPKNEDRDYTFGIGLGLGGAWVNNKYNPFSWPLKWLHYYPRKLFITRGFTDFHYFQTSLKAYTPDLIQADTVVKNDRPYSSIWFFSFGKKSIDKDEKIFVQSDFRIGILGMHMAREIQTWFHQTERSTKGRQEPYDPMGWHNQISNGGELTGAYRLTVGFDPTKNLNSNIIQVIPKIELSLGYQTYLGTSAGFRLGKLHSPWWSFHSNPMEFGNTYYKQDDKWFEVYGFVNGSFRYVFYDALLQGQFKNSYHTLDASDVVPLQAWLETGLVFRVGFFETWAALNITTPSNRLVTRDHYWMSLTGQFYF